MAGIVDADTHIMEPEGMWDFIDPEMYHRRPVMMKIPNDTLYKKSNALWLIDGNIFPKPAGRGGFALHTPSAADREVARVDIDMGSRELTDPAARIRDMDLRGVDVQVIFPTLFIIYLTDDPDLEIALCRAYNRWLAQAWAEGKERLRWTAVLPLKSIDKSLEEMHFAKENGATGVFFRGVERDLSLAHPHFFPIYEEAKQAGPAHHHPHRRRLAQHHQRLRHLPQRHLLSCAHVAPHGLPGPRREQDTRALPGPPLRFHRSRRLLGTLPPAPDEAPVSWHHRLGRLGALRGMGPQALRRLPPLRCLRGR